MADPALPLTPEVMDHARMWLPILSYALGGAGVLILAMGVVMFKLYKRCQTVENIDLRKAVLNLNKALGQALERIDRRFELGKKEFTRQRKVLRSYMIFGLAICEAVKVRLPDLDCKKILETLEELDEGDADL